MSGLIGGVGSKSGIVISGRPAFMAYLSSGANADNNEKVLFNTLRYNVGAGFWTSDNTFHAPVSGVYSFTINVSFNGLADSGAYFGFQFVTNNIGATGDGSWMWIWENSKGHDYWSNNVTREFELAAGNTCYVYRNGSAGGQYSSIRAGMNDTTFSGHLVG